MFPTAACYSPRTFQQVRSGNYRDENRWETQLPCSRISASLARRFGNQLFVIGLGIVHLFSHFGSLGKESG